MGALIASSASDRAIVVGKVIVVLLMIAVGLAITIVGLIAIWWPLDKIVNAFERRPGLATLVVVGELGIFAIGYIADARPLMIAVGITLGVTTILGMVAGANRSG